MRVTLTVTEGPHVGQTFTFGDHDTFLVGRSKRAHFRLPAKDLYFSRVHFLIEVNPPQCRLLDMGSRNGTHVNNQRVHRAALHDGDQIRAGKTVLHLTVADVPSNVAAPGSPSAVGQTLHPVSAVPPGPEVQHAEPSVPTAPPPVPARVGPPALPIRSATGTAPTSPKPPEEGCRGCGQPLSRLPNATPWLCPACNAQASDVPQTIPGFRLLRKIGQGAMGMVYLAVRNADGRAVALKTVTPAVAGSPAQVQRFLREAQILRQLNHPHIVGFCDLGEADGILYFAMDYVPGRDAGKLLKKDGPLAVGRAVTLICQMLEALAYAHERGFVHRDIKPSNLLVTEDNRQEMVKIVDFGLARVYQASQLSGLTLTGDIGGTMAFMPPEQITEYREARPPADQYASAATLYNLLTGTYIHDMPAEFHLQILLILQEKPVPIQKRRKNLPAGLAEAIHKALNHEPADRFADVTAFRAALLPFRA